MEGRVCLVMSNGLAVVLREVATGLNVDNGIAFRTYPSTQCGAIMVLMSLWKLTAVTVKVCGSMLVIEYLSWSCFSLKLANRQRCRSSWVYPDDEQYQQTECSIA